MDSICLAFVDLHVMLTRSLPIKTSIKSFQNSACLSGFDGFEEKVLLVMIFWFFLRNHTYNNRW